MHLFFANGITDRPSKLRNTTQVDLFVIAAEPSADLHGNHLIKALLTLRPTLKISAVAGPHMRELPIETPFKMESLSVMGFLDVLFALPRITREFFKIRKKILQLNPTVLVCIDYPGFNLRLEKSLRKKGFTGKIVHYIAPTVWIWGKKRADILAENVDLLLTFFPFEKKYFSHTKLSVEYVGHPLTKTIPPPIHGQKKRMIALFPGSRTKEVIRNLPLQIKVVRELLRLDPTLMVGISCPFIEHKIFIEKFTSDLPVLIYSNEQNSELMQDCLFALAKSGTVTLELALYEVPTVVHYAVHPIDRFIVQHILSINLPFYCIVNIIASTSVFPELFGPDFTEEKLLFWAKKLLFDDQMREEMKLSCRQLRDRLGNKGGAMQAARTICALAF